MGSFSRRAAGVVGAVLAGAGLAAVPSVAQAQTLNVLCSTADLINKIAVGNAATEVTLRLAPGCFYDLVAPAPQVVPVTRGPDGLPIITGDITVIGRNATIRRVAAAQFRILEVASGAVFRASNLTISGGDSGLNTGGGILSARGRVLLQRTLITANRGDNGGGISNDSGDVRLMSSTVSNNTATGGGGGGIYSDGFLLFERSRLIANQANTRGGGLFSENGGRVVLSRSDVTSNHSIGNGGGLHNSPGGIVQGDRMRFTFNQSDGSGGAVDNSGRVGSVTFRRSVFRNNFDGDGNPNNNNCNPAGSVPGCFG